MVKKLKKKGLKISVSLNAKVKIYKCIFQAVDKKI
jgi:hypothetical protein